MTPRRWFAIAVVIITALVVVFVVLGADEPPTVRTPPRVWLPDAGPLVLLGPATGLTSRGASFPSAVVTPALKGSCVRGRVVEGGLGQGIAAAQVTLETFAGRVTATADAAGRFELLGLPEGVVSVVEVSADGFVTARPSEGAIELHLIEGACVSDLRLSLEAQRWLEVEVSSVGGVPITDAMVRLAGEKVDARTNAAGLTRVQARDGTVVLISAAGFASTAVRVDFRALVTGVLTVRLMPMPDGGTASLTLQGLVVNEHDAGVAAARVQVRRELEGESWVEANLAADEAGRFEVPVNEPGPWVVEATSGGLRSAAVGTAGEPVRLVVLGGAMVSGVVRDWRAAPVASFSVLLSSHRDGLARDSEVGRHFVDAEGRFRLTGLRSGKVDLSVVSAGFAPSEVQVVELTPSLERTVVVTLNRGAELRGVVTSRDPRRPLPNARVSLEQTNDDLMMPSAVTRTDAEGRFTLTGLPTGRRSVLVLATGHDARLVSVELSETRPAEVQVDLAAVPDGGTPQLELVGIGAVLEAVGDGLLLKQVVPRGGAAEVGLVAGDVILRVDGASASSLGFAGCIERIRGAEDTLVRLEVRRQSGEAVSVSVPRRKVVR